MRRASSLRPDPSNSSSSAAGSSEESPRRASISGPNGSPSLPTSIQPPSSTLAPAARERSATSCRKRVLPTPASPDTRRKAGRPSRASARAAATRSSSCPRPISVGLETRTPTTTLSPPCLDGRARCRQKQGVTKEFPDALSVTWFEAEVRPQDRAWENRHERNHAEHRRPTRRHGSLAGARPRRRRTWARDRPGERRRGGGVRFRTSRRTLPTSSPNDLPSRTVSIRPRRLRFPPAFVRRLSASETPCAAGPTRQGSPRSSPAPCTGTQRPRAGCDPARDFRPRGCRRRIVVNRLEQFPWQALSRPVINGPSICLL